MGEPAEPDERDYGGDATKLQPQFLPSEDPLKPGCRDQYRLYRAGQGSGVDQPEGIAIFQISHDPSGGIRIAGEMLLDLNPPRGGELVIHVGEEVCFGDGIRHRLLQ
jgi:hypothetical protein